MSRIVHVVDYGVGNLFSVARAIEAVGGEARLCCDADEIARADRLVLPGVGAFRDGMAGLHRHGLDDAVIEHARTGKPLMGICLGMQMLASASQEFGEHKGLGLISGQVVPIPAHSPDGAPLKMPSVGWAQLQPVRADGFAKTALDAIGDNSVYLVHSFHFEPSQIKDVLATYDYEGVTITAAVAHYNIIGCQFHPEKSGTTGLKILDHFLSG